MCEAGREGSGLKVRAHATRNDGVWLWTLSRCVSLPLSLSLCSFLVASACECYCAMSAGESTPNSARSVRLCAALWSLARTLWCVASRDEAHLWHRVCGQRCSVQLAVVKFSVLGLRTRPPDHRRQGHAHGSLLQCLLPTRGTFHHVHFTVRFFLGQQHDQEHEQSRKNLIQEQHDQDHEQFCVQNQQEQPRA